MKLPEKFRPLFKDFATAYATIIHLLLYAVLIVVILALIVGVVRATIDLFGALGRSFEAILQKVLVDVVFIIALIEVSVIVTGYLRDGNVRLRYIVDTILIIMINELVSLWFRHPSLPQTASLAIIILTLVIVRLGVMYIESSYPGPKDPAV